MALELRCGHVLSLEGWIRGGGKTEVGKEEKVRRRSSRLQPRLQLVRDAVSGAWGVGGCTVGPRGGQAGTDT